MGLKAERGATAPASTKSTYILLGALVMGIAAAGALLFVTLSRIASETSIVIPVSDTVGAPIDPPRLLHDFTLPASTGVDMSLSELTAERWTVLFFGYMHCPDVCPLTLTEFKRVKTELGDAAGRVRFVFVSVDGRRDSPAELARYLSNFDADFIGLAGDDVTLAQIKPDFGLVYERNEDTGSAADYLVDHSTRAYLIDPEMRLHTSYSFATEPAAMAADIREYVGAG